MPDKGVSAVGQAGAPLPGDEALMGGVEESSMAGGAGARVATQSKNKNKKISISL